MTKMEVGCLSHKLYQDPIGLRVIKELVISCKDCNTSLVNVVLTETNEDRVKRSIRPLKSKYKVLNCSNCDNGSSLETEVLEGSTSICTAKDGFVLEEEDTDIDKDGVILSTLKVRKENVH